MPILRTLQLSILFISLSLLPSCKKDSKSTTTTNTASLTGVTWTSTKIEFQKTDGTWVTQTDDDFHFKFVFNSDNTFSGIQVYPVGNVTRTGAWHFINNNTQISLTGTVLDGTYTVTQLSSTTLQWTVSPSLFFGQSGVRETFTH